MMQNPSPPAAPRGGMSKVAEPHLLMSRSRLVVRGNHIAHNIVGLYFYGEAGAGEFSDNRFSANLTPVVVSAPGAGQGYRWRGNHWDDYQGFDRDGDGWGDQPHDELLFADRIWMETPMAGFFRASPVLELLDLLERLAPFSSPLRVVHDPRPRTGDAVPTLETLR